jgi:hypothetical protein
VISSKIFRGRLFLFDDELDESATTASLPGAWIRTAAAAAAAAIFAVGPFW